MSVRLQQFGAAFGLAVLGLGSPAFAGDSEDTVIVYDVREESTAVTAVSVISPENLYAWTGPSLISQSEVLYSAKQWINDVRSNTVSVWKNNSTGGAATKVVPAGDGEFLWGARGHIDADRIYFTLRCNVYSTNRDGMGGRRKHASSGYCDYGPVPVPLMGKLVFSTCTEGRDCFRKDSNYIWSVNDDGSELIQLRQGATPSVSPDGMTITFSYQGDIWVMGTDGSNVTNLTQAADFKDSNPQFSSDGSRIVFQRIEQRKGDHWSNPDIWLVDTRGTNVEQLTMNAASDYAPHWAADDFIYFISNRGPLTAGINPSRIWRMKLVE